jgi:hypothetical protein
MNAKVADAVREVCVVVLAAVNTRVAAAFDVAVVELPR